MAFFAYGSKELDHLKESDCQLGKVIEQIPMIERTINPEPFSALIESVISQQISTKAAQTVRHRLQILAGGITAENLAQLDLTAIQQCGMSLRKAGYIQGIADAAVSGIVDFEKLSALSDQEIIKKLSSLRGVGIWTAEMLLIFSLQRPDVVSYGDLAIRRGMMNLYGLPELPRAVFNEYRERYSPYGSVASLYLWAVSCK